MSSYRSLAIAAYLLQQKCLEIHTHTRLWHTYTPIIFEKYVRPHMRSSFYWHVIFFFISQFVFAPPTACPSFHLLSSFFTAAYTYERKSLENADCLRSIINNKIFHFLENAILRKNYLLALWYFLVWAKSYKIVFIIKHLWAPEDGKAMEKTQKWVISLSWFIKSYCENIKLSKVIGGSSRKKWISVVSEETKFTKVRSRTYC